jgi:transcriptional regulator with PAS, ATPase and Fis domain
MIAINCGAIPETLLESELFGHEKGAFTGAVETRKGLFEAAFGSTLFLDEIGEMSVATQVKLLRVLETHEFTRVGSTDAHKTDVRVIAATNRDLGNEVQRGRFRQDLYYRLRSAQILIPPLRERREDIPLLFAHFAYNVSKRLGIAFAGIAPEALQILIDYPWPGNIRELKNFIELVITLERGVTITEEIVFRHLDVTQRVMPQENPNAIVHLAGRTPEQAERELIYRALVDLRNEVSTLKEVVVNNVRQPEEPVRFALPPHPTGDDIETLLQRLDDFNLEKMERRLIQMALKRHQGNRRHAAEALGISERTLYRKLMMYNHENGVEGDLDGEDDEGEKR